MTMLMAYTSLFSDSTSPKRSGAMYGRLPRSSPSIWPMPWCTDGSTAHASPKSASFTCAPSPLVTSMMLSGLMSRCMKPALAIVAMPAMASIIIRIRGYKPTISNDAPMMSRSRLPSANSCTMYSCDSTAPFSAGFASWCPKPAENSGTACHCTHSRKGAPTSRASRPNFSLMASSRWTLARSLLPKPFTATSLPSTMRPAQTTP
mmetsp:Transcript_40707/g.117812  ORF Transcript_40707/g.117812 Transcript_40707/m.117812 type:complete len:205 (-) Transcript_40707:552-1166(-)